MIYPRRSLLRGSNWIRSLLVWTTTLPAALLAAGFLFWGSSLHWLIGWIVGGILLLELLFILGERLSRRGV